MNTRQNPNQVKPTARNAAPAKPMSQQQKAFVGLIRLQEHIDLMLDVSAEFETLIKGLDLSHLPPGFRARMIRQVELAGQSQETSTIIFNHVLEQMTEYTKRNSVKPRARPLKRPITASSGLIGLDLDLIEIPG